MAHRDPRQGLRQQGFAAAGRTDQQNVRLREFHITILPTVAQAFIVIVYRDRKHPFRMRLADDIVIEDLANFLRRWNPVTRFRDRRLVIFLDDVHAQLNAFIADEYCRASDQLADFVLALAAKRAIERILESPLLDFVIRCLSVRCRFGEYVSQTNSW